MPDPTSAVTVTLPCFALKPLSNRPVSLADIGIRPIDPATGRYGPPTTMTFAAVDSEAWALAFLADLDRVFEPDRARAAHRLAPTALADLAQARLDLAEAIARGLDVVRSADSDTGLTDARFSLREHLLMGLAQGFIVAPLTRITLGNGTGLTLFAANEGHAPIARLDILPGRPWIPAPLRAPPQPPAIVRVEARGPAAPATLAEAVCWRYALTLDCRPAAQDQLRIEPIAVGAVPQGGADATSGELFRQLAQYAVVAGDLRGLLDGLTAEPPAPTAVGALETWAGLVRAIADAWNAHAHAAPAPVPTTAPEPPAFILTFDADDEGGLTALRLARTGAMAGFGWPDLVITPAVGRPLTLIAQKDGAADVRLWPLAQGAVRAFAPVTLELVFAGLPTGSFDGVKTAIRLDRNGTSPHGTPMNRSFVYRGAPVTTSPVTLSPLSYDRLNIGAWSDDSGAGLLTAAISTVFDGQPGNRTFDFTVTYEYTLEGVTPAATVGWPVLRVPEASSADLPEIVRRMIAWRKETKPSAESAHVTGADEGPYWHFSVIVPAKDAEPGAAPIMWLGLVSSIAPQG